MKGGKLGPFLHGCGEKRGWGRKGSTFPQTHIQPEGLFPIILGEGRRVCLLGCKNPRFQHLWAEVTFLAPQPPQAPSPFPLMGRSQSRSPADSLFRAPFSGSAEGGGGEEALPEITYSPPPAPKQADRWRNGTTDSWPVEDPRPCPACSGNMECDM